MTAQQTFNEMLDSLTGYEEERIEGHFGRDIFYLLNSNAARSGRALIFIDKIREGMKSDTADENKVVQAAKKYAQSLTMKQVNEHFADEPDDGGDGDPFGLEGEGQPTSEAGKGDSAPAPVPVSSPPSVS